MKGAPPPNIPRQTLRFAEMLIAEMKIAAMRARPTLFARHPGDVGYHGVAVEIADIFVVAPGSVLADRQAPVGRRIAGIDPQRLAATAAFAAARPATATAATGASFAMVIDRRQ